MHDGLCRTDFGADNFLWKYAAGPKARSQDVKHKNKIFCVA
jgi:hypothetical protein